MTTPAPIPPADPLRSHSDRLAEIVDAVAACTFAVLGRRGTLALPASSGSRGWSSPPRTCFVARPRRRSRSSAAGGQTLEATLVGIDSSTDLALFRLASTPPRSRRSRTGDASSLRAGHIGDRRRPQRRGRRHRQRRHRQPRRRCVADLARRRLDRLIRLDGGVYDGLSGAPVADARERWSAWRRRRCRAATASSFRHRPSRASSTALLANGHVARPWLGIGAQPVPLAEAGAAAGAAGRRAACSCPRLRRRPGRARRRADR